MRSGIAYRLPPLAPLTFGTASGLLPTVTAQSYGSTNNGTRGHGTAFNTAGTPGLDTMARRGLIPTPTAGDAKSSGSRNLEGSKAHAGVSLTDYVRFGNSNTPRRMLPTPTATLASHGGRITPSKAREGGMLTEAISARTFFPTPQAHDHRSGNGFDPSGRGHSPQLRHLTGGLLNPAWVLWLMGFPDGHLQSALSEMRSSRRSPKRSDGRS